MKKKFALLSLTLILGVCVQNLTAQGRYVSGDFHQHSTYTDGSYTIGYMMDKNALYGLDWWANSEHGGAFEEWGIVSGDDINTFVKWENTGITILGKPNEGRMWRWQSLKDWSFRDVELYRKVYPEKLIIQGFEWNAPGHEHVDVAIIDGQFIDGERNCNALAEFEYKFDNSDSDDSEPNGWVKSTATGKAKTLEAVTWMQNNYPNTSWIVPTHPERKSKFLIEDFRNMNNAGPSVCFGFDSQPGHQKSSNRGGYSSSSYGAGEGATWGGTGVFAAQIGGVWDALLSEGRNWWLFANSDAHVTSGDFFPGEYQKTMTYVTNLDAQSIVDGLRSGNSYVVMGDLIDSLSFNVGTATMGETFNTNANTVNISIIVRDPQGINHNTYSDFNNPELDHIDIIAGVVGDKIDPSSPEYTNGTVETTKVIARFGKYAHTDANGITTQIWEDLGNGVKKIDYTFTMTANKMYFRLRGTHHAFGGANTEIDENGNPLVDIFGENTAAKAFEDLWFYSNPIFVATSAPITSVYAAMSENTFNVFPNPAKDILNIEMGNETNGKLEIFDMTGKQVMNIALNNEKNKQISVANLAKGSYVVKVNDFAQQIVVK